jgi:hypothetical protein
MSVPTKYYDFVDGQTPEGKVTAARLNGNLDPLFACLNPAVGGLEDDNVKSGAKILVSDRNYTGTAKVTGDFEFDACPVVPDASIPNAKLQTSVMLKTTYDTDADGKVNDSDKLDGQHASDFVGNSHDHFGGDGAAIPEGGLSLSDVTTGDVSTAKHGLCPKAPNDAAKFLRGDGAWAANAAYVLSVTALTFDPVDAYTYYIGNQAFAPTTASGRRVYIPKAGTIKVAYLHWLSSVPSNENISVYIRLNNTADTLIAAIGDTAGTKVFSNAALSIAVVAGDYIEVKIVCPTWATNPTNVALGGTIYIE